MKGKRSRFLMVERLESKNLMSVIAPSTVPGSGQPARPPFTQLVGEIKGTWHSEQSFHHHKGQTQTLHSEHDLLFVTLPTSKLESGELTLPVVSTGGAVSGVVVLKSINDQGSIRVRLSGTVAPGDNHIPTSLTYSIAHATQRFVYISASGPVSLDESLSTDGRSGTFHLIFPRT